jgi:IS5 family transposase
VNDAARGSRQTQFTALLHHVDVGALERAFRRLRRKAAPGIDGVTVADYEGHLEANLQALCASLHRNQHRAQPVLRTYIPKADGDRRPLGILALEDKIVQGKARTPYEFRCKLGIAATNREDFVVAAKAFEGNPYDGHTLAQTLARTEAMSGVAAGRVYVDRGYRGHDVADKERIYVAGRKRGVTQTIRRELRRRSSIEAAIGHMKTDGRLDRTYLLGTEGDAVNVLLAAAGYNLQQVLRQLRLLFALVLAWITAQPNTAPATPTR